VRPVDVIKRPSNRAHIPGVFAQVARAVAFSGLPKYLVEWHAKPGNHMHLSRSGSYGALRKVSHHKGRRGLCCSKGGSVIAISKPDYGDY